MTPVSRLRSHRKLPSHLRVHTVSREAIEALDPTTYEVVRHRLWSITDEVGQEVQIGLYNTMLADAVAHQPDLGGYPPIRRSSSTSRSCFASTSVRVAGLASAAGSCRRRMSM